MDKTKTPAPKPLQKPAAKPVLSKPLVKPAVKKPTEKVETKPTVEASKVTKSQAEETEEKKPSTAPIKVPASSELATQLESLHGKLDKLEGSVERLRRKTPSVFGRFLADLAKVILLAALLTVAWQTGWVDRFLDWAATVDLSTFDFSREKGGE